MGRMGYLLVALVLLQGCSYEKTLVRKEAEASTYDPASMARIRLFSSPELSASYQPGATCEAFHPSKKNDTKIAARQYKKEQHWLLWAKTSLDLRGMEPEDYQNRVIGMPETKQTRNLRNDRVGYDEFVIPAGKPTVVMINFTAHDSTRNSDSWCFPPPVALTPEAGKDYEISLVWERPNIFVANCRLSVAELVGQEVVKDVREVKTALCAENKNFDYDTVNP